MTYEPYDVVTMPFPFADSSQSIVRPAVILTDFAGFGQVSGIAIVAMITSAKRSHWPFDAPISDLDSAGLSMPCLVRQKLNSVAYSLMDRKIGVIAAPDRASVSAALRQLLAHALPLA